MSLSTHRWLNEHQGVPPAPRLRPLRGPTGGGPRAHLTALGHLRPVLREGLLPCYLRWALEERDDFIVWFGPTPQVVVVRPESALAVVSDTERFVRNPAPTEHLFGRGLLRMDGRPWRERRERFSPSMSGANLGPLVATVQSETDRLLERWSARGGAPFKPARELSFAMLRVLGRFLFGLDFDEERHGGPRLHRALITLSTNVVLRHLLSPGLADLRFRKALPEALATLNDLCVEILDRGGETPFLTSIREGVADGSLDRETALDELRTVLVAGHETSATALSWTLTSLAEHGDLAAGVRGEAEAAARVRSPRDLAALEHTERWVRECLRLFPPVPLAVQQAARSTTLGRLEMRVGTRVDLCSFVLHRLPWLWPEPERFSPERWRESPVPGSYLPFLLGPHTCLGRHMAQLELSIVTARLAGAFDFVLPNGPPVRNLRLSLHPQGLTVRALRR